MSSMQLALIYNKVPVEFNVYNIEYEGPPERASKPLSEGMGFDWEAIHPQVDAMITHFMSDETLNVQLGDVIARSIQSQEEEVQIERIKESLQQGGE